MLPVVWFGSNSLYKSLPLQYLILLIREMSLLSETKLMLNCSYKFKAISILIYKENAKLLLLLSVLVFFSFMYFYNWIQNCDKYVITICKKNCDNYK